MVRKVSVSSLQKMSRKQLEDRIGRLEAEFYQVRLGIMREMKKPEPSKARMKDLERRRAIISDELKKTFRVYIAKMESQRRKKG